MSPDAGEGGVSMPDTAEAPVSMPDAAGDRGDVADTGGPEVPPLTRCPPRPTASGSQKPGEPCAGPADCMHAPSEIVTCAARDDQSQFQKKPTCHLYTRAGLGEACTFTWTRSGYYSGLPSVPNSDTTTGIIVADRGAYCDLYAGLVCDTVEHRCRPLPALLVENCTSRPFCEPGASCNGGACRPAFGKLGGFCSTQYTSDQRDTPICEASAHCDGASSTCVPDFAAGERCDYGSDCVSGTCIDSKCAAAGVCPP